MQHLTTKRLRTQIANVREYLTKDPGTHPISMALYKLEQSRLPVLESTLEKLEAKR
jgi:hypothetical protein